MKYLVIPLFLFPLAVTLSQSFIRCGSDPYYVFMLEKGYISVPLPAGSFGMDDSSLVNIGGQPVSLHCRENRMKSQSGNDGGIMILRAGAGAFYLDTVAEKPAGMMNFISIDLGDGTFASAVSYEFLSPDRVSMRRLGVAIAMEGYFLSLSTIQPSFDAADKLQKELLAILRRAAYVRKKFSRKKFCP